MGAWDSTTKATNGGWLGGRSGALGGLGGFAGGCGGLGGFAGGLGGLGGFPGGLSCWRDTACAASDDWRARFGDRLGDATIAVALTAARDRSAATPASAGARLGTARSQPSVSRVPSAQRPDGGLARKPRRGAPMPYIRFQGRGSRLHSPPSTTASWTRLRLTASSPAASAGVRSRVSIRAGRSGLETTSSSRRRCVGRASTPWVRNLAPISRVLQAALAFVGASRVPLAPACWL